MVAAFDLSGDRIPASDGLEVLELAGIVLALAVERQPFPLELESLESL